MRRRMLGALFVLAISMCVGCSKQEDDMQQYAEPNQSDSVIEDGGDYLPDTSLWTQLLTDEGVLDVDLDEESQKDKIVLSYEDYEGSQQIQDFYVLLNGNNKVSIFDNKTLSIDEQEDRTLEDIMAFDFNKDSRPEYLFLFDTHGTGGNGTHDAWILWLNDMPRFEILNCLEYYQEGESKYSEGGLDTLYKIQHINGDNSKMQTYQYSYLDGHSDYTGDLVSLVGYDAEKDSFVVIDSWKENNED